MVNILGEDSVPDAVYALAGCHVHWYGKEKRAGRKMGHINVSAASQHELKATLVQLADLLDESAYPALKPAALAL
jgi:5-(carboxyamino)imidazole ribonucleotide synthase